MASGDFQAWTPEEPRAVLGQRMSPEIFAIYTQLSRHFCALKTTPRSVSSVRDVIQLAGAPPTARGLHAAFLAALVERIDAACVFPAAPETLLLGGLPTDLPCHPDVDAFVIGAADPREALRGELGVMATRRIPEGELVGLYRGDALFHSDYVTWKLTPPPFAHPLTHERTVDAYTVSSTEHNAGQWAAEHGLRGMSPHPEDTVLMVCATYCGNATRLVNDPCIDPMASPVPTTLRPNVCLCEFVVGAWPFFAMFTLRPVRPGDELRYEYGRAFWEFMKEHALRKNAVDAFYRRLA